MSSNFVDYRRSAISRRAFLQAAGLALFSRVRLVAAGFSAITDELARLFRVCSFGAALQAA